MQMLASTDAAEGKSWQFKIIGQSPFLCILSPESVQHVLQSNFDNYVKVGAMSASVFD